jgi:spore coat protein CotF
VEADFDLAFIEQMIHHQMGVMMASMAQTNSQHPQLRAMQQAMVKAQSREIEQMSQWYRNWYGTTWNDPWILSSSSTRRNPSRRPVPPSTRQW